MAKKQTLDDLTYEQAFQELQAVVEQLEAGDLPAAAACLKKRNCV